MGEDYAVTYAYAEWDISPVDGVSTDEWCASLVFSPGMPYAVCAELTKGGAVYKKIESKYFMGLIADMLRFFGTGEVSFDPAETPAVMKLRGRR